MIIQQFFSCIRVRTEIEGFHYYPNASEIDERIKFLESPHRHLFKISVEAEVFSEDRELEFFLVKWALEEFLKKIFEKPMAASCEMIAKNIIENHLIPSYGKERYYQVIVSEDGENDGIVNYFGAKSNL